MKIFNSIQELWDYCSFCPVCQNTREMSVSVGPDDVFTLDSFSKRDSILELQCQFHKKQNIYYVSYKIDCNTNSFDVQVTNVLEKMPETKMPPDKVKKAYFFFYIQSNCQYCDCSTAHGKDLELDMLEKKVYNIGLERESHWLLNETDKFHISVIHDRDVMLVTRCYGIDEFDFREDGKSITLPLVKLDLSNQHKVVNKIKTLILFS
jgi:hypothetical protein